MPITLIQKRPTTLTTVTGGTQYVEGVLAFNGATTITLASDTAFPTSSNYVLFDYSAGSFPGGQSALDAYVTVTSALTISDFDRLVDEPRNKRVVLKLKSKPTNGTQYVAGDLTINNGATMTLSADLYATPGEYILFEVTGSLTATLSGGSPNYLTQFSVTHSGVLSVGSGAYWDSANKQVKITLT